MQTGNAWRPGDGEPAAVARQGAPGKGSDENHRHPGAEAILAAAAPQGRVKGLVGGLHGFQEFNLLENLEFICATHCTQYGADIEARFPAKCVPGGVGTVIEC